MLEDYMGTFNDGKRVTTGLASPYFQFSSTGFFGSNDSSNNPASTIIVNGTVQTYNLIGYDDTANSVAGMTDTLPFAKGTVIIITV